MGARSDQPAVMAIGGCAVRGVAERRVGSREHALASPLLAGAGDAPQELVFGQCCWRARRERCPSPQRARRHSPSGLGCSTGGGGATHSSLGADSKPLHPRCVPDHRVRPTHEGGSQPTLHPGRALGCLGWWCRGPEVGGFALGHLLDSGLGDGRAAHWLVAVGLCAGRRKQSGLGAGACGGAFRGIGVAALWVHQLREAGASDAGVERWRLEDGLTA
mmetsp:Transcript_124592/g.265738  ORF Transcript_124592/g.265738 Transcript_124592/m.265738 type:complete len:218 (+) Transcript_124592:604-1257(+)